jgi:hypothetical protein
MNFQSAFLWLGAAVLVVSGYQAWGWVGVALVISVVVFWLLLHFTRMMQVLKKATARPKGYVDSAVMLNAKLKHRMTLLQIIGLTKSLGEQISVAPEVWRWTDNSGAAVRCEFQQGKLSKFNLERPTI